ncbi:MAG: SUMF1/EgtB/PvdO family nonheme iron enzyme [Sphingobacteriia bacterium]
MKKPLLLLAGAALLAGCATDIERAPSQSSVTGRNTEEIAEHAYFKLRDLKYQGQEAPPGMVFIEGGTFHMGGGEQDIEFSSNNRERQVSVTSFYIDQTEITNLSWKEFMAGLGGQQQFEAMMPDTTVWYRELSYNEPYVLYYFQHPGFLQYPVVGVDWYQCMEFCKWRTNVLNEDLAAQDPESVAYPAVRLPTEAEWEYAARAGYEQENYPWEGKSLREAESRFSGDFNANFKRGRGDYAGRSNKGGSFLIEGLNDKYMIPAPVTAYMPNEFGLYEMAGNVGEWTLDVYRVLSYQDVEDLNPFRRRGRVTDPMQQDISYGQDGGSATPSAQNGRLSLLYSNQAVKDYEQSYISAVFDPAGFDNSYDDYDNTRVYRGGSWNDPAYYLTCGSRRFMYADSSSSTIGFRCVMTRVGSPSE